MNEEDIILIILGIVILIMIYKNYYVEDNIERRNIELFQIGALPPLPGAGAVAGAGVAGVAGGLYGKKRAKDELVKLGSKMYPLMGKLGLGSTCRCNNVSQDLSVKERGAGPFAKTTAKWTPGRYGPYCKAGGRLKPALAGNKKKDGEKWRCIIDPNKCRDAEPLMETVYWRPKKMKKGESEMKVYPPGTFHTSANACRFNGFDPNEGRWFGDIIDYVKDEDMGWMERMDYLSGQNRNTAGKAKYNTKTKIKPRVVDISKWTTMPARKDRQTNLSQLTLRYGGPACECIAGASAGDGGVYGATCNNYTKSGVGGEGTPMWGYDQDEFGKMIPDGGKSYWPGSEGKVEIDDSENEMINGKYMCIVEHGACSDSLDTGDLEVDAVKITTPEGDTTYDRTNDGTFGLSAKACVRAAARGYGYKDKKSKIQSFKNKIMAKGSSRVQLQLDKDAEQAKLFKENRKQERMRQRLMQTIGEGGTISMARDPGPAQGVLGLGTEVNKLFLKAADDGLVEVANDLGTPKIWNNIYQMNGCICKGGEGLSDYSPNCIDTKQIIIDMGMEKMAKDKNKIYDPELLRKKVEKATSKYNSTDSGFLKSLNKAFKFEGPDLITDSQVKLEMKKHNKMDRMTYSVWNEAGRSEAIDKYGLVALQTDGPERKNLKMEYKSAMDVELNKINQDAKKFIKIINKKGETYEDKEETLVKAIEAIDENSRPELYYQRQSKWKDLISETVNKNERVTELTIASHQKLMRKEVRVEYDKKIEDLEIAVIKFGKSDSPTDPMPVCYVDKNAKCLVETNTKERGIIGWEENYASIKDDNGKENRYSAMACKNTNALRKLVDTEAKNSDQSTLISRLGKKLTDNDMEVLEVLKKSNNMRVGGVGGGRNLDGTQMKLRESPNWGSCRCKGIKDSNNKGDTCTTAYSEKSGSFKDNDWCYVEEGVCKDARAALFDVKDKNNPNQTYVMSNIACEGIERRKKTQEERQTKLQEEHMALKETLEETPTWYGDDANCKCAGIPAISELPTAEEYWGKGANCKVPNKMKREKGALMMDEKRYCFVRPGICSDESTPPGLLKAEGEDNLQISNIACLNYLQGKKEKKDLEKAGKEKQKASRKKAKEFAEQEKKIRDDKKKEILRRQKELAEKLGYKSTRSLNKQQKKDIVNQVWGSSETEEADWF